MDVICLDATWLGRVPFQDGYELQVALLEQRKSGFTSDKLLLMEHDHVYTHGRRGEDEHVLVTASELRQRGVAVVRTDRGGETTYHGPGQLIVYPIVSIRDLNLGPVAYVRLLEEATIQLLMDYGVPSHRVVGKTGVWVGGEPGNRVDLSSVPKGRKVAAIGVRVSGGVAMHGIAINVSTDIGMFNDIVPCGMHRLRVTSIENETGETRSVESVGWDWATEFADILGFRLNAVSSPYTMRSPSESLAPAA